MTSAAQLTDPELEVLSESRPRRLVVVDDHRVFAQALAFALSGRPELACVGVAHSVTNGLALVERLLPDLVVMDVRLGDGDGVAATAQLTRDYPSMSVVVLTGFVDTGLLQRVADAGASALLPKDGELDEMLQALRSARRGRFIVHPSLLKTLIARELPAVSGIAPLSELERSLLQLLAAGLEVPAIARELGAGEASVRADIKSLLGKLGASSYLDAVVIAMRNGLLHVPDAG